MKIVFINEDQNGKEYETEAQDLTKIVQIADKLSDYELEKLKQAIDSFQQTLPKQSRNKQTQEA